MQTDFFNSPVIVIFRLCTFVSDVQQAQLAEVLSICASLWVCGSAPTNNYAVWKNEP